MPARPGSKLKRVDKATTKRSRLEACYWGSMGVALTREAYMKSLGDAEPSADKLPDFGTFPEHLKRAEAMKRAGREPKHRPTNMPYLRHLRACKHAKSMADVKLDGADQALAEWEPYASKLHEVLVKATRYYGRKAYEKDDFKQGKEYHKQLTELFPQYDEKLTAFRKAVDTWRDGDASFETTVKLDEGGKVAKEALDKARQLTAALLEDERDQEAVDKLLGEVGKLNDELAALREEKKRPPHPKVFGPKLTEFLKAAKEAAKAEGKLTAAQTYPLTAGLALLFELNQRSMEQLLRQRSARGRRTLRTLDPRRSGKQRKGSDGTHRARQLDRSLKK
jgi:hypothetical protein